MRILVVSAVPWNTNNSFGNSYSNIFSRMKNVEIDNIFFASGEVNDIIVKHAFRITPREIVENMFHPSKKVGEEVRALVQSDKSKYDIQDQKVLNFARTHRFSILYMIRDVIWRCGKWNSPQLKEFINRIQPELLFTPINGNCYMNRIVYDIAKETKIPMIGYISDDNYTLRHFRLSPFYWLGRFCLRYNVKKVISQCKYLYVISDIQKKEYDKIFHKNCRILTKGMDFGIEKPLPKESEIPYHMVFAGNIGSNRWKSLALIGKTLQKLNSNGNKMDLTIYTATPITVSMRKQLNIEGCIKVAGQVPYSEVANCQKRADILIHVEATDMVYRWGSHQGFSTKIVDYMASNRPILAYGKDDQASIAHLKKNDAALVATTPQELEMLLKKIIDTPKILQQYADNAWKCGAQYHDIHKFHAMLAKDFNEVLQQ